MVLLALVTFTSSGCLKWFSATVATGIARLTVRNVGAVLTVTAGDERCGFESPTVLENPTIEGEVGDYGRVIWHVQSCGLDFNETQISTDCLGTKKTASGSIVVTADKIVEGRLTGDASKPVIPESKDAVTFVIHDVSFDNFSVRQSGNGNAMTIRSGSISAKVQPLVAVATSNGACSIPTPHVTFSEVRYRDAVVFVETPDREFEADVDGSEMSAQNGTRDGQENALSGTLTVWGKTESVPESGDPGLDPEYDRARFDESFLCTEDLALPLKYSCELTPTLGHGAARLTIRTLGGALTAVNENVTCGFENPDVLAATDNRGTIGEADGEAVMTVSSCTLDFPTPTVISTDCYGNTRTVQGRIVVSGTKSVLGYLTGDPASPVVPTSRDPATIEIDVDMTEFAVKDSNSDKWLTVHRGRLSGAVSPRTAIDTETGACSVGTPVARFARVQWSNADVTMTASGLNFDFTIDRSDLNAVNGPRDGLENHLWGDITADGELIPIPISDPDLDPEYDAAAFLGSYDCQPTVVLPSSDAQCRFTDILAENVARLMVKSYGVIGKRIDEDDRCGFAGVDGLLPANLTGDPMNEVTASWTVSGCALDGAAQPIFVTEDCNGKDILLAGTATVTATKTVSGALAAGYPPIEPQHRRAARVDVHAIDLSNVSVLEYLEGKGEPEAHLMIHRGTLSGVTHPITGEAADNPGAYFIKTPVAYFEAIRITNASATLYSGAKQFNVHIDEAFIDAFNGTYGHQSNALAGHVLIDGERYPMPEDPAQAVLDPNYDQATFDASYACTENLAEVVPTRE